MTLMQSTTMADLLFHFEFIVKLCLSGLSPGAKFSTNLKASSFCLCTTGSPANQSQRESFPDANKQTKSWKLAINRLTDQKYISFRDEKTVYKWHLL